MRLYAIGDLHLAGGDDKPMDIFGEHWRDHWTKIARSWREAVTPEDVVLIPGDISWAMTLERAVPDLLCIGAMPGRKVMIRGNHDYWWSCISKVRAALAEGFYALQNDAMLLDGTVFCGSRGWGLPGENPDPADEKIYRRELQRMRMSLASGRKLLPSGRLVAMIHYPPTDEHGAPTPMTALFEEFGTDDVVYGHLHGASLKNAFSGETRGVRYHQVSCDRLGFQLYSSL